MVNEPQPPSSYSTASADNKLVQRYLPFISTYQRDTQNLRIIPGGFWVFAAAILLTNVAFGIFRLGIQVVYTESLPFLILGLAFGLLSQTTGFVFVVMFSAFDFFTLLGNPYPDVWLGRFISYWLLSLLVVTIPNAQRTAYAALAISRFRQKLGNLGSSIVSTLIVPLLIYLWTVIVPYLIRPIFRGFPSVGAMRPLQQFGWLLAGIGLGLALLIAVLYQRHVQVEMEFLPSATASKDSTRLGIVAFIGRIVLYIFAFAVMRGIITSPFDVILLLAAMVIGEVFMLLLGRTTLVRDQLVRIPYILRFGAAFFATFGTGYLVLNFYYHPALGSEFFPIVLAAAIGIVFFQFLVGVDGVQTKTANAQNRGGKFKVMLIALPIGLLLFTMLPNVTFADNCSGLGDCAQASMSCGIAAAIAAILAAIWNWIKNALDFLWHWLTGVFIPLPPGPVPPVTKKDAEMQRDAMEGQLQNLKEQAASKYLRDHPDDPEGYYRIRNLSDEEFIKEFGPPQQTN